MENKYSYYWVENIEVPINWGQLHRINSLGEVDFFSSLNSWRDCGYCPFSEVYLEPGEITKEEAEAHISLMELVS